MRFITMGSVRRAAGAAAIAAALLISGAAHASHYFISDISARFSELEFAEFERFGFRTTEDILRNVDTAEDREALSSATGLSVESLREVARFCDLLQIEGIGPRAFDLLVASGVTSAADLATREAESLHAEIVVVNSVERITGVDPEVTLVGQWIAAAADVPIRVQY